MFGPLNKDKSERTCLSLFGQTYQTSCKGLTQLDMLYVGIAVV